MLFVELLLVKKTLFVQTKSMIKNLESIVEKLKLAKNIEEKLNILNTHVQKKEILNSLSPQQRLVYKSLQLIDQDTHLFGDYNQLSEEKLNRFFDQLWEIEKFYSLIGGIAGYHLTFLKLLEQKKSEPKISAYERPEGIDLTAATQEVAKAVRWGIEFLNEIGEIYPVAGAGDRLNLKDSETNEPLPAAVLNFAGCSLLKGLIRDLQAREFLYYKITGRQAQTPIVLMTSTEKNNDFHIREIIKENKWFHRPADLYFYILQPLVPVITIDGVWAAKKPLELILKPGGHGVIWQLAEQEGALNWLLSKNRKKALVRQINNPIAGIDNGLIAFTGIGCKNDKAFGFAACPKLLGASEGVDVLIETVNENGFAYSITNIEYTEFERFGIKEKPSGENKNFSIFPANTNILFVDIPLIKQLIADHPFPGLLINLKSESECLDQNHCVKKITVGRVESTMQNIADYILTISDHKLNREEKKNLRTFVTFNHREKTISTTKKLPKDEKIAETPEGAFYDLQCNHYKLFSECGLNLPEITHEKAFLKNPPFIITYHPGLGPLFSVIRQKIRNGKLDHGAELRLEIAELKIQNIALKGSLLISALCPLGNLNEKDELHYSENMGKCILENVQIENMGIDFSAENTFWNDDIIRKEVMCIHLEGNAEFEARNVHFNGPFHITVPSGHKMTATMEGRKVMLKLSKLEIPSWHWTYSFDNSDQIKLSIN